MSTDTTTSAPHQERRGYPPLTDLRRSRTDRHVAGVSGGLGRYAGIDPLVFRILFVVLTIFGGSGILLYALGWLLVPEEGETESEGRRLMNGRASRSKGSILALSVVVVAGVIAIGATVDSGWGVGGLGVLAVIGLAAVLLLRNGQRDPQQVPGPVYGPVPPPAEPGAYGQTTGTAYAAPAPAPLAPQTATFAPQTATFAPQPRRSRRRRRTDVPGLAAGAAAPPAPPKERSVARAGDVVQRADRGGPPRRLERRHRPRRLRPRGVRRGAGRRRSRSRRRRLRRPGARPGRVGRAAHGAGVAAAVVPDVAVHGGIGDRTWRPATVADLRSEYRLGIGDAELDLTRLDLTDAGRLRVEVRQGVGDLTIVVPDDVVVLVDADVQGGDLRLPDRGGHRRDRPQRPRGRARGVVPAAPSSSSTPSWASAAWRCAVRRHELDVFSLVTGLVFVAVAAGHLLDESSQLDFDGRWVVPLVMVAIGVAGLRRPGPGPEARPAEATAADAPTGRPGDGRTRTWPTTATRAGRRGHRRDAGAAAASDDRRKRLGRGPGRRDGSRYPLRVPTRDARQVARAANGSGL